MNDDAQTRTTTKPPPMRIEIRGFGATWAEREVDIGVLRAQPGITALIEYFNHLKTLDTFLSTRALVSGWALIRFNQFQRRGNVRGRPWWRGFNARWKQT